MLTKELYKHASSHAKSKGLSDGQTTSSSYSFCPQQGSCGSSNQDGTEVLYITATTSLKD